MAVSLILEVFCCNVLLKPFVARLRPCDVNTAVRLLIPHPEGFSFPSGHTGLLLSQFSVPAAVKLFLIGMVAISAMFLPGISGSTLLLIFGAYIPVIMAVTVVKAIRACLEKFRPQTEDEPEAVRGISPDAEDASYSSPDLSIQLSYNHYDTGVLDFSESGKHKKYEIFDRVSCWCCPLQSLEELRKLRVHFPEPWEKLKDWDEKNLRSFRADDILEQLEIRF